MKNVLRQYKNKNINKMNHKTKTIIEEELKNKSNFLQAYTLTENMKNIFSVQTVTFKVVSVWFSHYFFTSDAEIYVEMNFDNNFKIKASLGACFDSAPRKDIPYGEEYFKKVFSEVHNIALKVWKEQEEKPMVKEITKIIADYQDDYKSLANALKQYEDLTDDHIKLLNNLASNLDL